MNSLAFIPFILLLNCAHLKVQAQTGTASSDPLHPLQLLENTTGPHKYLQISYSSPYGVKSIQDVHLNFKRTTPRGLISAEIQRVGVKGYSQLHFAVGYALEIGSNNLTGIFLNADLYPMYSSGNFIVRPGSSIFSRFIPFDWLNIDLYINNWTSFWMKGQMEKRKAGVSLVSRIKSNARIIVIAGFNYTKSFAPLFRAGIYMIPGKSHGIAAGLQTGPPGFWVGYSLTMKRLVFSITIQTGGIFGYEPGSSVKYTFN